MYILPCIRVAENQKEILFTNKNINTCNDTTRCKNNVLKQKWDNIFYVQKRIMTYDHYLLL